MNRNVNYVIIQWEGATGFLSDAERDAFVTLVGALETTEARVITTFPLSHRPLGPFGFLRVWWSIRRVRRQTGWASA